MVRELNVRQLTGVRLLAWRDHVSIILASLSLESPQSHSPPCWPHYSQSKVTHWHLLSRINHQTVHDNMTMSFNIQHLVILIVLSLGLSHINHKLLNTLEDGNGNPIFMVGRLFKLRWSQHFLHWRSQLALMGPLSLQQLGPCHVMVAGPACSACCTWSLTASWR